MIEIIGPEGSSEHIAAVMIRDALEGIWPGVSNSPIDQDNIKIAVSAKISGYRVQDIDIVLAGRLSRPRQVRPTRVIRGQKDNRLNNKPLLVESFVTAIEVKDHNAQSVRVNNDQVEVRYSRSGKIETKSATDQNIKQVHTLKAYLSDRRSEVFVRRCLMFPSLSDITAPSAVASGFSGHQLLSAIASAAPVLERRGCGYLSAGDVSTVEKVLACPLFRSTTPTRLDRERMDRVVAKNPAVGELLQTLGTSTVFLRGYAGTGKTVLLLQAAWKQFQSEGKRTLILTYNLALAADMRRLMALMRIPSSSSRGGIEVATVMSFLFKWFTRFHLLENDSFDFSKYPELCAEAIEMIHSGAVTSMDIEKVISSEPEYFDFDNVFVDEGQDWPKGETTLLKDLYSPLRLCVADGIDQFTRGQQADWRAGIARANRATTSLSICLRLKRNLSLFVAQLAKRARVGWDAQPNTFAGGGRVIVLCKPYEKAKEVHQRLVDNLRKNGNAPVDMLFCVPPCKVDHEGGFSRSLMSVTLEGWGEETWDGVNPNLRTDFARSSEQARIVQYASCRGLEGWTVVLDSFDDFLELVAQKKLSEGLDQGEIDSFVDLNTAAVQEAWRWGMIALTRPIDTLVIQLNDPDSRFSQEIIRMAKEMNDFTELVD